MLTNTTQLVYLKEILPKYYRHHNMLATKLKNPNDAPYLPITSTNVSCMYAETCFIASVTRLGSFLKVRVTNFLIKVDKMFGYFWSLYWKISLLVRKKLLWLLFGPLFILPNFRSHCLSNGLMILFLPTSCFSLLMKECIRVMTEPELELRLILWTTSLGILSTIR